MPLFCSMAFPMKTLNFFNETYILFALIGGFTFLIAWNIRLHSIFKKMAAKHKEIYAGSKTGNLEEVILQHGKAIRTLDKDIQELYSISNQINTLALRSVHKVGLIRFNPFKDIGGDQSFSLALLNGKNNGLVISSLYTKEGTRIYSKSVLGGKTEKYPLTEEEEQAIKMAVASETRKVN